MGRVFEVSPSGFSAGLKRPPSRHAQDEARLDAEIRAAHQRTRETDGPGRLQKDLAAPGVPVGLHRLKRMRKKLGLRCRQKRKFKANTDSAQSLPVAENRLGQDHGESPD
jgi:putative transposase